VLTQTLTFSHRNLEHSSKKGKGLNLRKLFTDKYLADIVG